MQLTFLGATNTVTGSRFLLDTGTTRILVDCGLFQGYKYLRERNWSPLQFDPKELDAVVLTHAHIDHSGYVPLLVRDGFGGPVYCTHGTRELCKLLLPDSGHLQEEEAAFLNRIGASKHKPARPLYTKQDALHSLEQFDSCDYDDPLTIGDITLRFLPAGHILGSSLVSIESQGKRIVFSGDVGRQHDLLMNPPAPVPPCDYLVLESTYGNRLHANEDPRPELAEVVTTTIQRGGVVLIPSFAVGRAQEIIYLLTDLMAQDKIPELPIFLDSPMAINASHIFLRHPNEHKLSEAACRSLFSRVTYVREVEESIALNDIHYPHIIISASGMATGGRVLHHLKRLLPDAKNSVLFVGYQAGGTRGARLVEGEEEVKIHGKYVRVKAQISNLDGLSAHADYSEMLSWLQHSEGLRPKKCFLVHGEENAIDHFRCRIDEKLGWNTVVPSMQQTFKLD
jgi:metallo-beta-lactamase family protein